MALSQVACLPVSNVASGEGHVRAAQGTPHRAPSSSSDWRMFVMRSKVWLLAVLLVACGGPAAVDTTTISTTTAVAVSTTAAVEGPTAIVSLSPTATEILAAI